MSARLQLGQPVLYQSTVGELIELTRHDSAVIRVNDVVMVAKRWELIPISMPEKALGDTTLSGIDDSAWNAASDRATAIRNVLERPNRRSANVRELAKELNVSERQAWRLLKQFEQHQTVSGLLKQAAGRKVGTTVLDLQVERIISDRIESFYLKRERPTPKSLCERVAADCRAKGLKPPTDASIKRRLDHYEDRKSQGQRIGSKKAKYIYDAMPGHVDVSRPLQRVEIDHTPLDVMSISDDPYCDYVGRPWLTVAIDVYTRCVLGFLIGFEPPSILAVALCLTDAVRIKSPIADYGVPLDWQMHGIPKEIVVDNGRDFVSVAFQRGCDEHGIVLTYRPIGSPHYGGAIERLIGTMVGRCHLLPGTTKNSIKAKGAYDSAKHATLTLRETRSWFAEQLLGQYHLKEHRSLRIPPIEAWQRSMAA